MFDGPNAGQQTPASGQDPPEIMMLAQEWQAARLAERHVAEATDRVLGLLRKALADLAAAQARIAELEAHAAELGELKA